MGATVGLRSAWRVVWLAGPPEPARWRRSWDWCWVRPRELELPGLRCHSRLVSTIEIPGACRSRWPRRCSCTAFPGRLSVQSAGWLSASGWGAAPGGTWPPGWPSGCRRRGVPVRDHRRAGTAGSQDRRAHRRDWGVRLLAQFLAVIPLAAGVAALVPDPNRPEILAPTATLENANPSFVGSRLQAEPGPRVSGVGTICNPKSIALVGVGADHLATRLGPEPPPGHPIDAVLDEFDAAVGEQDVASSGVVAGGANAEARVRPGGSPTWKFSRQPPIGY